MNTRNKRPTTAENSVIITAAPKYFCKGTRNRADRLVAALKPITDTWYPKFSKASVEGSDAIIETYNDFRATYIATPEHLADEIFRYTALAIILNSVRTDAWLTSKVKDTTIYVLHLLFAEITHQVEYWFPRQRFNAERELFDYAKDIDSLCLEK